MPTGRTRSPRSTRAAVLPVEPIDSRIFDVGRHRGSHRSSGSSSPLSKTSRMRQIALLGSFYLAVSPELEPYLVAGHPTHSAEVIQAPPSAWQLTLTAAGMSQCSTASWWLRAPASCW